MRPLLRRCVHAAHTDISPMSPSPAGTFFAQAFESQCREAIDKKLAGTSSLKKMMAGIVTVQDAQAKGYAPSDAQIAAIAASICEVADAAYGLPVFCEMPADVAATQLVQAISPQVGKLNDTWREQRLFHFDTKDLADMMEEARGMVAQAHKRLVSA